MARKYSTIDKMSTEDIVNELDDMINILHRRDDIIPVIKGNNVIKIYRDQSCKMACIKLNGVPLMEGNFWDFHPGCHGGKLRVLGYITGDHNWNSISGLRHMLVKYITQPGSMSGQNCQVFEYDAKYGMDNSCWTNIQLRKIKEAI